LSDAVDKYALWKQALDDSALAERLFTSALNLAELRRGGLFVVLADLSAASDLLMSHDRLDFIPAEPRELPPQDRFNYLLRGKSALDLTPTVLESIARIDGAIVPTARRTCWHWGHSSPRGSGPFAAEETDDGRYRRFTTWAR
jgi:hypothetical protein